jgi:hypothetical protein
MGVKISALALKASLTGDEQLEINDGGITKKVTASSIAELGGGTGILVLWDFSANAGAYPTNPNKLYIATDSSVVPANTWFVANTPTPSGFADFFYK